MESSENIQEPQIIDTLDIPVSQDGKDEERTGLITNIQMFCTNDGPGIRTTVFLKGCRLNCRWCHNPEGKRRYPEIFPYTVNCTGCKACVEACPMDALSLTEPNIIKIDKGLCTVCLQCVEICKENAIHVWGRMVKVKDVIDEVAKDKPFYDNSGGGMTVSGGEPTAQPEFTLSLFRCAKEREINCALDTCGHTPWEVLEPIIELTDYVLYDIKHMDPKEHKDYCGFSNTLILNNARKIAERGIRMRIRVPVIPGRNDTPDNFAKTADFIKELNKDGVVDGVDLLPYHPFAGAKYRLFGLDYPFLEGEGYDLDNMGPFVEVFLERDLEVTVGG